MVKWSDNDNNQKRVILYLQGGHTIEGYLDFDGYARCDPKKPSVPLPFTDEGREKILTKGLIEMQVDDQYFRTHASLVVGFTVIDEDLEKEMGDNEDEN